MESEGKATNSAVSTDDIDWIPQAIDLPGRKTRPRGAGRFNPPRIRNGRTPGSRISRQHPGRITRSTAQTSPYLFNAENDLKSERVDTAQPRNKRTLRDRKTNPSTQIHSLRKLIAHGKLPATLQQEKERELAGLLFEQQKAAIKSAGKKNLSRYHFIRFVERQKAMRTLKKLKKQKESVSPTTDQDDLDKKIHEAEVDLNYCLYAPLAHKYIAIYARDSTAAGDGQRPLPRNLSHMIRADYALLSHDQQTEIERISMEEANTLHMVGNGSGVKPPMWYIIEGKMKEGQKALEEVRDQPVKEQTASELLVGLNAKIKPDWLNDDGMIDPDDLDNDDADVDGHHGVKIGNADEDEDMSDGDGGFFERR